MGSLKIVSLTPEEAEAAAITRYSLHESIMRQARRLGPVETLADAFAQLHVNGGLSRQEIHCLFQKVFVNYSRKRFFETPPTPQNLFRLISAARSNATEQWHFVGPVVQKLKREKAAKVRREEKRHSYLFHEP